MQEIDARKIESCKRGTNGYRASGNDQSIIHQLVQLPISIDNRHLVANRIDSPGCVVKEEANTFAGDLFRRSMGQLMPIGYFTTHIEWDTADAIVRVGIRYDDSDTPPGAKAPRLLLPLLCTGYAEKWSVAPTRCASYWKRNGTETAPPFMRA